MNESRERVGAGGMIRIPPDLLHTLRISEGDEVDLKAEASKLVLIPVTSRKRMKLRNCLKNGNRRFLFIIP